MIIFVCFVEDRQLKLVSSKRAEAINECCGVYSTVLYSGARIPLGDAKAHVGYEMRPVPLRVDRRPTSVDSSHVHVSVLL